MPKTKPETIRVRVSTTFDMDVRKDTAQRWRDNPDALQHYAVTGCFRTNARELVHLEAAYGEEIVAREPALDEKTIAAWIRSQMESGNVDVERLPELMARYALTRPEAMRAEFGERMQVAEDQRPT